MALKGFYNNRTITALGEGSFKSNIEQNQTTSSLHNEHLLHNIIRHHHHGFNFSGSMRWVLQLKLISAVTTHPDRRIASSWCDCLCKKAEVNNEGSYAPLPIRLFMIGLHTKFCTTGRGQDPKVLKSSGFYQQCSDVALKHAPSSTYLHGLLGFAKLSRMQLCLYRIVCILIFPTLKYTDGNKEHPNNTFPDILLTICITIYW